MLRDLGATPEEIRAIAVVFGARARDGNLKEGQKLRVLLSPVRGTERLQPVRVMLGRRPKHRGRGGVVGYGPICERRCPDGGGADGRS